MVNIFVVIVTAKFIEAKLIEEIAVWVQKAPVNVHIEPLLVILAFFYPFLNPLLWHYFCGWPTSFIFINLLGNIKLFILSRNMMHCR